MVLSLIIKVLFLEQLARIFGIDRSRRYTIGHIVDDAFGDPSGTYDRQRQRRNADLAEMANRNHSDLT